jgi:hypothetical protein
MKDKLNTSLKEYFNICFFTHYHIPRIYLPVSAAFIQAWAVFKGKVHTGFLAAIIAASNAGGAFSVIGDTTTILMWIDGVSPFAVDHAFIASAAALAVFGIIGALQQDRYHAIIGSAVEGITINYRKLFIVFLILVGAIATNYLMDFQAARVWIGIFIGATFRTTPWDEMRNAWIGAIFLMEPRDNP